MARLSADSRRDAETARPRRARTLAGLGIGALLLCMPVASASGETLGVGLAVANDITSIALFAGQEAGSFKKRGVDVEVTVFRGGGAALEALAAGAVPVVNASSVGVAAAQNRGVPQICIGVLRHNAAGWYLMVDYNSKITKLSELDGKKVAITSKGSTTDFYALWAAEQGGAKIETIPLGSTPAMASALKSGQVDASILYNDFAFKLMESKTVRPLVNLGEALPPHSPGCWVSTPTAAKANHATLVKFFAGLKDATEKFRSDKPFALALLSKLYKDIDPAMREFLYGIAMKYTEGTAEAKPDEMATTLKLSNVDYKKPITDMYTNELVIEASKM